MELLVILAIILLASPVLAIAFGVLYYKERKSKNERLNAFALKLYNDGRISRDEFVSAVGFSPPDSAKPVDAPALESEGIVRDNNKAPAPSAALPAIPKKHVNTVPVILALGVVLICAAEIAFVTSTWNTLGSGAKIGAIAVGAAVFFAAFALAEWKLLIPNTARAFYLLGSAALSAAALAAVMLNVLPLGTSLGARAALPFVILTLGAFGGYRMYRSNLFLALAWIAAYTSTNFLSLWLFSDAFGRMDALFPIIPTAVSAMGVLFVMVFRAERFRDNRFYITLSLAAFGLSALISAIVSAMYIDGARPYRAVLALSMIVITITLSVAAKTNKLRFIFPLQSIAAMWTAHTVSGVIFLNEHTADWRVVADVVLMLAAFLWSRFNIRRASASLWDRVANYAHNVIFPFSLLIALSYAQFYGNLPNPHMYVAVGIIALVYIALMLAESHKFLRWIYVLLAFVFNFLEYNLLKGDYVTATYEPNAAIVIAIMLSFALVVALVTNFRLPNRQSDGLIQHAYGFMMCAFIGSFSLNQPCRILFFGMAAAIALLDALSYKDSKTRRVIAGVLAYGSVIVFIDSITANFEHLWWPWGILPAVSLTVSTAVLVAESILFHKKGTAKRATFIVAVVAYSVFALTWIGIVNLYGYGYGRIDETRIEAAIALIVFGAIGCFVIYYRERTFADVAAALAVFVGIRSFVYSRSIPDIMPNEVIANIGVSIAVCAGLAFVLGRKRHGYSNLRAVWLIACHDLFNYQKWVFDPYRLINLAAALLLSLNLLQYLRARGKDKIDKALISVSAAIACLSLTIWVGWLPDLVRVTNSTPLSAVMLSATPLFEFSPLILVAGAFVTAIFVWKFNRYSHWGCFVVSIICAALIYFGRDYASPQLLRAAVVTVGALAAICASMRVKLGRWFAFGIACPAIVFFRETAEFWLNMKWWVYLLAVGLALVAIAAVNEVERRKGLGLWEKVKQSRIREWTW
ncbi:MAG: hypothetical protein LBL96_11930 [Clostridiales bacterium]|jgi:hypothetical protein|nr:hypothetical protein [Clostridiales bacterium]